MTDKDDKYDKDDKDDKDESYLMMKVMIVKEVMKGNVYVHQPYIHSKSKNLAEPTYPPEKKYVNGDDKYLQQEYVIHEIYA